MIFSFPVVFHSAHHKSSKKRKKGEYEESLLLESDIFTILNLMKIKKGD